MRKNPPSHTPYMWALSNEVTLTKKSKFSRVYDKNQVILRQILMGDKDQTRSRTETACYSPKLVCYNWQWPLLVTTWRGLQVCTELFPKPFNPSSPHLYTKAPKIWIETSSYWKSLKIAMKKTLKFLPKQGKKKQMLTKPTI